MSLVLKSLLGPGSNLSDKAFNPGGNSQFIHPVVTSCAYKIWRD
jgi:hypothetical protein